MQLAALAGAGAVVLGACYLARRSAGRSIAEVRGLNSTPSAAAPSSEEATCECGLTLSQGGCTAAASSSAVGSPFNTQLLGTVEKYEKHFIICSGTEPEEWGAKIDRDEGSFASEAKKAITARKSELTCKFKLTNSDEKSKSSAGTDLIVFPGTLPPALTLEHDRIGCVTYREVFLLLYMLCRAHSLRWCHRRDHAGIAVPAVPKLTGNDAQRCPFVFRPM